MPLYMVQAAYEAESSNTMAIKPEQGGEIMSEQLEKLGGRLIGFYQGNGAYDAVAICELPNDMAAGNLAISVRTPGYLKDVRAIRLRGALLNRFLRLGHSAWSMG